MSPLLASRLALGLASTGRMWQKGCHEWVLGQDPQEGDQLLPLPPGNTKTPAEGSRSSQVKDELPHLSSRCRKRVEVSQLMAGTNYQIWGEAILDLPTQRTLQLITAP